MFVFGEITENHIQSLDHLSSKLAPCKLKELLPVHEAAVVLVDGPEGEGGLVPFHSVRPDRGALGLPAHLLQVVLDAAAVLGTLDKLLPSMTMTVRIRM